MPVEPIKYVCLFLNSLELECCRIENQGYILLLASEVELEQVLDEILVVSEYPYVFPNMTYPNFSQKRKLSFLDIWY